MAEFTSETPAEIDSDFKEEQLMEIIAEEVFGTLKIISNYFRCNKLDYN